MALPFTKEEFKQKRLEELKSACTEFLNDQKLEPLEKSVKALRQAEAEYYHLEEQDKYHQQNLKDRADSQLPLDLLAEAYELQARLSQAQVLNDRKRWQDLFLRIMGEVKVNNSILKEKEAVKWIARSTALIDVSLQVDLVEYLWAFVTTSDLEQGRRLGSLLKFMLNHFSEADLNRLKNTCVIDKATKYSYEVIEAYEYIHNRKRFSY